MLFILVEVGVGRSRRAFQLNYLLVIAGSWGIEDTKLYPLASAWIMGHSRRANRDTPDHSALFHPDPLSFLFLIDFVFIYVSY